MLGGPGWAQCRKNADCSNIKLSWKIASDVQQVVIQGTFLDEQDTNDIDGPEFFIIDPAPPVNPLPYSENTVTLVLPFTFQVNMNKLLIDLPPPSFSLFV